MPMMALLTFVLTLQTCECGQLKRAVEQRGQAEREREPCYWQQQDSKDSIVQHFVRCE